MSPASGRPCHRCCKHGHRGNECSFWEVICNKCGKKGHLARVCRSVNNGRPHQRQTHAVEAEPLECDQKEDEVILTLHSVGVMTTVKPFEAELEINGKKVDMEIDTGAADITLYSESPFP